MISRLSAYRVWTTAGIYRRRLAGITHGLDPRHPTLCRSSHYRSVRMRNKTPEPHRRRNRPADVWMWSKSRLREWEYLLISGRLVVGAIEVELVLVDVGSQVYFQSSSSSMLLLLSYNYCLVALDCDYVRLAPQLLLLAEGALPDQHFDLGGFV